MILFEVSSKWHWTASLIFNFNAFQSSDSANIEYFNASATFPPSSDSEIIKIIFPLFQYMIIKIWIFDQEFAIYSTDGRLVSRERIVQYLTTGIYIVKLVNKTGLIRQSKIYCYEN